LAGLAGACFLAIGLGNSLTPADPGVPALWPAAGIGIAAVVLWGPGIWPGVSAGVFAASLAASGQALPALVAALGDTLEALAGGMLVRRFAGGRNAFQAPGTVFRFALFAGLLAPLAGSALDVAVQAAGGPASPAIGWPAVTRYFAGAAGVLVVAPVLVQSIGARLPRLSPTRLLEPLTVALAVAVVGFVVFSGTAREIFPGAPLVFVGMPVIVWAAFRLGLLGTAATVFGFSAIAVAGTLAGQGPFAGGDPYRSLVLLQLFMVISTLTALPMAALVEERRRAAQELELRVAQRTATLRTAQEIARLGSWEWDIAADRILWSDELYRIFGLHPNEFPATYDAYLGFIHPEDRDLAHRTVMQALADHQPFAFDHRVVRQDGTVRVVHGQGMVELDASGKPVRMTGTAQDITSRKRVEGALRESLERFQALADGSPLGIFHTTPEGTVDYANARWMEISGCDSHDFDAIRRAVHPDDLDALRAKWRACLAGGTELVAEFRYVHADGQVRECSTRATPIRDASGQLTGFVGTVEDTTGRRQAEAERREVERLRLQAEFKTNFLRTAAHELGNPLTPVKIQLRILKGLLQGRAHPDERKAVDILDRNVERISLLVHDMLESARLQSGRVKLLVRPMDLAHAIHDVVETFQETAIQGRVALDAHVPSELPMEADSDRVTQVLFNLVSNAMKFTPEGGRITVRAEATPTGVRVTVADTGLGFTAAQALRLFQPFAQVHDGLPTGSKGGTGLGLYISKGLVEQHGGTLTCSSAGAGTGATFTFEMPRVASPPPVAIEPEASVPKHA
jgi:PAS domain S-box-containing protein